MLVPIVVFHRYGEIFDQVLELISANPINKVIESFTFMSVGLIVMNETLDGIRNALGRYAHIQAFSDARAAVVVVPAKHDDVAGDLVVVELHCGAIETNVGNVVPTTAVWTTTNLNVNLLCQRILDVQLLNALLNGTG